MHTRVDTIVVGAGLAGALSTFWLSKTQQVLLLEAQAERSGASQIAAGIVNPFAGLRGKPMWRGLQALTSLDTLVAEADAQQHYNQCGVLRPAVSRVQVASFRAVAEAYPDHATWMAAEAVCARYAGVSAPYGALRLYGGGLVDTPGLIDAALASAMRQGAAIKAGARVVSWKSAAEAVHVTTHDGQRYTASRVLLCLGSGYVAFETLRTLNLHRTKGQIVRVRRPVHYDLTMPLSAHGYVVPIQDDLLVGTTYDRDFTTEAPTPEASARILRAASAMVPGLDRLNPLSAMAGIRVGVPGTRLPMVGSLDDRVWVFTGLGSKGLLFASLLAQMVPSLLAEPHSIPPEIRVTYANSKHLSR